MRLTYRLPIALALMVTPPLQAHHAFAAAFDGNTRGTVEGIIVETFFRNPHIQYYITVTRTDGSKETWAASSMSPNRLRDLGWTKKSFTNGDKITVEGFMGRDNKPKIWIQHIEKADGTSFQMHDRGEPD